MRLVSYNHHLEKDSHLRAYALDPAISEQELKEIVMAKDGTSKFDLESLSKNVSLVGELDSLGDLKVTISPERYKIPKELKHYRKALEKVLLSEGKTNGGVAILQGNFQNPLTLCPGGYFDFMATKLSAIPAEVLPREYPPGRTIEELMPQWRMSNEQRARFLGFAFILYSDSGNKINLVQRAKNMGIAPDCISCFGGTPEFDARFFEPNFDFKSYYLKMIAKEMREEGGLETSEFDIRKITLIEDATTIPHVVFKLTTPLPAQELAQRCAKSEDGPKEQTILYNMPIRAVEAFLKRFEIWPVVSFAVNDFNTEK